MINKIDPRIPLITGLTLLMILLASQMPGCMQPAADNSYQAFAIAGEARVAAIHTAVTLNNAGLISPEDYDEIDELIWATKETLEVWGQLLIEQKPVDGVRDEFYQDLNKLNAIGAQFE